MTILRRENTTVEEVEIYKLVLNGSLRRFPNFFWMGENVHYFAPKLVRYMIDDVLGWKQEVVPVEIRKSTFCEHKLATLLSVVYDSSPYLAVSSAYPERNYKPWDFVNAPNNYWRGEEGLKNAICATRWLIEEKLGWSREDVVLKLNLNVFKENNLLGMIRKAFDGSMFEAINKTYPGEFNVWDIGEHVRNEYWDIGKGKFAVRWLIEEKLKWSIEDIKKNYCKQIYIDNNLYGMLQRCFDGSSSKAIMTTYPNMFHEWELPVVSQNFWTFENAIKATKWMVEERLEWTPEEVFKKCTKEVFVKHQLITICDKYKILEILKSAYPEYILSND